MTASTEPRVRIARYNAVCGARGCLHLIYAGAPITQPPGGGAWKHEDCKRPGKRTKAPGDDYGTMTKTGRR